MGRKLILTICSLLFIIGCSSKKGPEYNKSDIYWYNKMVHYVAVGDLDKADDYFTSLQSEHFSSPLLPQALLILAQAHMDEEEYLLANYYLDEYIKRFAGPEELPFIKFLKIKSSYLAFKSINRDQKLLQETIQKALKYKEEFPESTYLPMVDTILTRLYMAQYVLESEIASLYERIGKERAAKLYRERVENSWLKREEIEIPKSWIDYLINW
ncbi:MAG: outer membrane protein assembly factor BamD [Epsilonproteobacteria bacterium]|nr:outer membrane protein assembly factor BamD [Campylobacterota bacterium]NPA57471.1 outer membrane protein assembly factor BamD [Campylobacterota bacterium]